MSAVERLPVDGRCVEIRQLHLVDRAVGVLEARVLHVGRLLIGVPDVDAAVAVDLDRVLVLAHGPAHHVHVVDAGVADVGGRGVPEKVPAVVEAVDVEGRVGSGAEVEIPMHAFGNGGLLGAADRGAALVDDRLAAVDIAPLAGVEEVDGRLVSGIAAAIQADLDDAVVLSRRFDHLAAFVERVAAGLLDIDVLAGLAAPNGVQARANGRVWRRRRRRGLVPRSACGSRSGSSGR